MEERRHTLTRKDPIEVWVPSLGDATPVEVKPLPWRIRNNLGNSISTEFRRALDEAREKETGSPHDYINYDMFLEIEFPGIDLSQITYEELMPLLHFMCEVNGLESALWMLDPEAQAPNYQQTEEGAETDDGEKILSTDDSSQLELVPGMLKN